MKTSQEKKLDAFDSKCIRQILGIRLQTRKSELEPNNGQCPQSYVSVVWAGWDMSRDFRPKDLPTEFFNGTHRDRGGGYDQK